MSNSLLITKVNLPLLRQLLVPRKKVLGRLHDGLRDGHLLTLVSAPAGYGKTTTTRMWVEEAGHPIAWMTLEKSDNDLKQFLIYVLTALGGAVDDLGQAALEMVENAQEVNAQAALGLLVNDLHGLDQPVILVLEEYHLIENETIDQAVEFLLNQAVASLRLVIITREDPNLPLTRLRARNQLTEIRAADLSFSLEEAGKFFADVMGINLPARELEILKTRTEGWAAGLQLAALSLKESKDAAKFIEAFRGTHRHVLDYLIEEVLNSQPEEIRAFLRQTSVLDQLSAPLCEAVTGQKDSAKILHYLETSNLFLVSLDEERTWYRYHALFAELLRNQLAQVEPKLLDVLQERAADWYEKNGFIHKAVEHAFQIADNNKVFALIEKHAMPMLHQGEVSTVIGWFDRLPEAPMQSCPMMFVSKAWALALTYHSSRADEIERVAQAAERSLDFIGADRALRDRTVGYIASVQAYLMQDAILSGEDPRNLIAISQRAQELLPKSERAIRCVNALNIGYGYMRLGDLSSAEQAYTQVLEDGVAGGNWYAAVYGQLGLISIQINKGALEESLQMCDATIERFNRYVAGRRFPPIGELHSIQGGLLLEQNRLGEAEQALLQGLSLVPWTRELHARLRCYSTLARLRLIQGDLNGMLENIKALEESRSPAAIYAQTVRHRFLTRGRFANQANLDAARAWAANPTIRFKNLPDVDGVDPVSEFYLRARLNVAHILARLAKQNPKGVSLSEAHSHLARHEKLAETHGLLNWQIELWIARAVMYQAEGKADDARRMIESALAAAAPRGYFRLFLDEGGILRPLLESTLRHSIDRDLSAYVQRLLDTLPDDSADKPTAAGEGNLSEREIQVLRLLADGESYKEIGEKLFLSLNTVQFHVKSIYRKLLVNKRTQAIEKARELKLI